jgi:hypothetical protein
MKLSRIGLIFLAVSAILFTSGCGIVNRIRAKSEINEAARAYKSGKYAEAEQHSRRALELDPDSKNAPIFIARTVHAQYRPGNETPENIAIADRAIAAYKFVLEKDQTSEEAYLAVTALLGALKKATEQRAWILAHAKSEAVSVDKRAGAYALLASQDWSCVYQITELAKQTEGTKVIWVKPKEQKDYDKAQQCLKDGLMESEQGIALDPNSELAWTYKTNLLREQAKIAEMDGKPDEKEKLNKQADEAAKRMNELADQTRKKKEAEEAEKAKKEGQQPAQ